LKYLSSADSPTKAISRGSSPKPQEKRRDGGVRFN
jgi:hypothetical protein